MDGMDGAPDTVPERKNKKINGPRREREGAFFTYFIDRTRVCTRVRRARGVCARACIIIIIYYFTVSPRQPGYRGPGGRPRYRVTGRLTVCRGLRDERGPYRGGPARPNPGGFLEKTKTVLLPSGSTGSGRVSCLSPLEARPTGDETVRDVWRLRGEDGTSSRDRSVSSTKKPSCLGVVIPYEHSERHAFILVWHFGRSSTTKSINRTERRFWAVSKTWS